MVAVPEICLAAPVERCDTGRLVVPVHSRRVVAVAVTAMELLRPESDLARLLEGFPHVDLLVAADDAPADTTASLGVLGGAEIDVDLLDGELGEDGRDDADHVRDSLARLGLEGLQLHRLGLRTPLGANAEGDLVAALSELVGFDPEPGLYCLAPAPAAGDGNRAAVNRAARRIAQVYGIPLLRYRCLELTVVGEDGR